VVSRTVRHQRLLRQSTGNGKTFPLGPASDPEFAWVDTGDRAYRAESEIRHRRVKDIIIKAAAIFIRTKSKSSPGAPQEYAKAASWHLV
jgi:hypothetical protein